MHSRSAGFFVSHSSERCLWSVENHSCLNSKKKYGMANLIIVSEDDEVFKFLFYLNRYMNGSSYKHFPNFNIFFNDE